MRAYCSCGHRVEDHLERAKQCRATDEDGRCNCQSVDTDEEDAVDTPQQLVAVVSSSYQRFRAWCAENGMNPRDPSLCLVQRIDHVRGRWFDDVVYLGENQPHLLDAARSRLRSRTSA